MLRWLVRTGVSLNTKRKCVNESSAASRSANQAKRNFDYAKRENDMQKQINYLAEGLSNLADAVERSSNTIEPLAELAVYGALLTESIEDLLDEKLKEFKIN
ncbi:MAG: hypothetical protein CL846_01265 [Crocinitomicaceae bacterium]|nr:hypothetical protein [Crocinitomicaceae bacterium]|tara:strand:- start:3159 stop:3464 length:306 start_codon:yes stop_codon:yes gene_type:complete